MYQNKIENVFNLERKFLNFFKIKTLLTENKLGNCKSNIFLSTKDPEMFERYK